jgi:transcriptional regulator with XRE-family HTH domain
MSEHDLWEALKKQVEQSNALYRELSEGAPLADDAEYVFQSLRVSLAEVLFRAMEKAGFNENQLAEKLGVTRQAVHEALAMKGNMTLKTLAKYSVALQCEVEISLKPRAEYLVAASAAIPAKPALKHSRIIKNASTKERAPHQP